MAGRPERADHLRSVLTSRALRRRLSAGRWPRAGARFRARFPLHRERPDLPGPDPRLRSGLSGSPAAAALHGRNPGHARRHGRLSERAAAARHRPVSGGHPAREWPAAGDEPGHADRHQGEPHRARGTGTPGGRVLAAPRPGAVRGDALVAHRRRVQHLVSGRRLPLPAPAYRHDSACAGAALRYRARCVRGGGSTRTTATRCCSTRTIRAQPSTPRSRSRASARDRLGHVLAAVRLDSGDLDADSRYVRRVLDEAGPAGRAYRRHRATSTSS